jgi:septal ring factor EnvC (AmiA/AmiB activator)
VFAGPFRDYGLLLILAHGDGYHTLLAGMSRLHGAVGQQVLAGEPVGEMGDAGAGPPMLYVELRRGGEPINPTPWLAAGKGKVSG